MKVALIVGISGQDGSYLAEYLLSLGYDVFGLVRRDPQTVRHLRPILDRIEFVYGDLRDKASLEVAIHRSSPDELYNLAPEGFVPTSWAQPAEALDIIGGGLARILSIVERVRPQCRVYEASSSEMFGNVGSACTEETPMRPESPYGVAKLAAHRLVEIYRAKGLFTVGGILFSHESPRRAPEIVTKKIASAVAHWARGERIPLELGDLTPRRDWGFAGDYVRAIHLMLQNDNPVDYVIATGKSHSVNDFLTTAIQAGGLDPEEFTDLVHSKNELKRANEIYNLYGCAAKARSELNWQPTVSFEELVQMMVRAEINSRP